ncbi:ArdC-like ssDNA-binding domain-containing protein, partial [Rhizobium beringeri]
MSRQQSNQRSDIYSRITNTIIADLERGVRPWTKPWTSEHATGEVGRPLRHNGQPYTGINVLLLWSEAIARGFASSSWMTFRQAIELGGA